MLFMNSMVFIVFIVGIIGIVLMVAVLLYQVKAKAKAGKEAEAMQKCTSCGSEQPKSVKFCEKCGTSLTGN